jgi:hypothetical protein
VGKKARGVQLSFLLFFLLLKRLKDDDDDDKDALLGVVVRQKHDSRCARWWS